MTRFTWPDSVACAAFLSVNFDADSFDLLTAGQNSLFGRYSYGRYGTRAGFPRLMDLLARTGTKATFFVPASDARRHPELVRRLVKEGHELAARGVDFEDLTRLSKDEERATLRHCRDILADIAGVAPVGFRAPHEQLSPHTLSLLAELGFEYDSSFQDGDYPYLIETGDDGRLITEIPITSALQDAGPYSSRHTHRRVLAIWRDEAAANYAEGVLIPLVLHLRGDIGSTRAARIAVLESFLQELQARKGLVFMTGKALAEHTRSLNLPAEPDPVIHHLPTLEVTPYRGDLSVRPI